MLKPKLTYANVAATLALVFSMTGSAIAAHHYLITSTKQISPKVIKALKGNKGPQGPKGETGTKGERGEKGEQGLRGETGQSALSPLPSGQSESGDYGIRAATTATSSFMDISVTYPVRLAQPIANSHVIYTQISSPVTHCSGPGHADPGYLCVYSANSTGVSAPPTFDDFEESSIPSGAGRYGFDMEWSVTGSAPFDLGTYTVTAP